MHIIDNIRKDDKPIVVGILNVTPDSFSDGGKFNDVDRALKHVEEMIADGADMIDIGGESTRPGYEMISSEEEIARVCPVIEAVKKNFDIPVSLDTYKASVAEKGIAAGVDYINDIWGLKWDDEDIRRTMAEVVAAGQVGVIIMHNRWVTNYSSFINDCINDLNESLNLAEAVGIAKEKIILDPGIGFAKNVHDNLVMMNSLDKICKLGYPVLLGVSRKSMIGLTLDLPKDEREEGTIAANVFGLMKGCRLFRVHDVKKNRRALDMTYAMMTAY